MGGESSTQKTTALSLRDAFPTVGYLETRPIALSAKWLISRGGLVTKDELLVAEFLKTKGLSPQRFGKAEHTSETPDFRLLSGEVLVGFCEVKSRVYTPWEGVEKDTTTDGLSADIHKAVSQFDAVNPELTAYNLFALVNHEPGLDWMDLDNVLTGNFYADSGEVYPIYRRVSEGRIRMEKRRIDLYMWFNPTETVPFMIVSPNESARREGLCNLLGVDVATIPHLP
jgi:hypothetical protein